MRVWALQGPKTGDNAQALALAARLGVRTEVKTLVFNWRHSLPNRMLGAGIASLDKDHSDDLSRPWPDAVIAVGRRTVPVARWIKAQSGGRCVLIHIGRPRAPLELFDLVITTPQYGLPEAPNVIHNTLPVVADPPPGVDSTVKLWAAKFCYLPKPWIAVFVGGNAWPLSFSEADAEVLGKRASALAKSVRGSLIVTPSRRTPPAVLAALEEAISVRNYVHGPKDDWGDPHRALLALAERFVVTSDSASMIAEAAITGKPVWLFELPTRGPAAQFLSERLNPATGALAGSGHLMDILTRGGWFARPRNMARIHGALKAEGWVGVLDEALTPPRASARERQHHELNETLARIKALLRERRIEAHMQAPPPGPSASIGTRHRGGKQAPASGVV